MDAGCEVSWSSCFDEEAEISAIQHAYNALIDDGPEVFASEYQNDPVLPTTSSETNTPEQIASKINGYKRGQVPQEAAKLTGFIDVQKDALFWTIAAWSEGFSGWVVNYGTYPEQKQTRFQLSNIRRTLSAQHPGHGLEGSIFAGLSALTQSLFGRDWIRDDGSKLPIDRLLIDANWGESSETIYSFCRQSKFPVIPSHGKFVKASSEGLNDRKRKPGEARGLNWRIPPLAAGKPVRHAVYDTNFWKSFVQRRLATPIADPGALTLFEATPNVHEMFAEHLAAETPTAVTANGRTREQWDLRPGRDNHFLDCIVGSAVAASMQGIFLAGHREGLNQRPRRQRQRVSYPNSIPN
jgi:phage terminase large subunit GpA-like protein